MNNPRGKARKREYDVFYSKSLKVVRDSVEDASKMLMHHIFLQHEIKRKKVYIVVFKCLIYDEIRGLWMRTYCSM